MNTYSFDKGLHSPAACLMDSAWNREKQKGPWSGLERVDYCPAEGLILPTSMLMNCCAQRPLSPP